MQGGPAEGTSTAGQPRVVGRYAIYDAIASGGMATVHLGRLLGPVGFLRTVAVKRLHPHIAHDQDFVSMFLDEARLAARIQHPNVVATLDVVLSGTELLLVMEYVRGESLSRLAKRSRELGRRLPPRVVVAIVSGALQGLHAAHEAVDEKGEPLELVHRDMTPQNILVGADGVARVLDFGIAKAAGRVHTTREGDIKGKVLYMAPEQLAAEVLDRRADIYAAGIVLFEALTGIRMFAGDNEHASITKIIKNELRVPSELDRELIPFDAIVRRACAGEAKDRYATAREMALALDAVMPPASPSEVGEWVQWLAGETLGARARMVAEIEASSTRSKLPPSQPSEPSVAVSGLRQPPPPARETTTAGSVQGIAHPLPSVATPERRSPALVLLLSSLLLASLGTIGILLSRDRPPAAALAASPTGPDEEVDVAPVGQPAGAGSAAAPDPAAKPPPTSVATAAAAPVASSIRTAKTRVTSSPRAAPVRTAVSCDPPYVVDKQGHRHFIPECVK